MTEVKIQITRDNRASANKEINTVGRIQVNGNQEKPHEITKGQ